MLNWQTCDTIKVNKVTFWLKRKKGFYSIPLNFLRKLVTLVGKGCRSFIGSRFPCFPADPWQRLLWDVQPECFLAATATRVSQAVCWVWEHVQFSSTGVNSCLCLISRQQDTDFVCFCPCGVSGSPGKEHSWFIPESSPSGFFLGSLDSKLCPWAKARTSILLSKWSSTWEAINMKGWLKY